ncbi:MAG: POTRA domain-containing protein, partial [Lentimonas sp.]
MRFLKITLCLTLSLGAFSIPTALTAQEQEETYPVVNKIETKFTGFRAVSDEYVFGNVQLRPGMNYNPALVDQSIRVLYSTGYFEFVEVKVNNAADDKVDVVIKLISKYTIQSIRYVGNDEFSDSRLANKAEIDTGIPLDEYQVSQAADKVQAYYVEKGFPDVSVDYRIDRDDETGLSSVYFDVDEGGEVHIDTIRFVGNEAFKDKVLRKQLETSEHGWLSWITGSGKFDETLFK